MAEPHPQNKMFLSLAAIEGDTALMQKLRKEDAAEIATMNHDGQKIADAIHEKYTPYDPNQDIFHATALPWLHKLRSAMGQNYKIDHDLDTVHLNLTHKKRHAPHDAPMRHWKMEIQCDVKQLEEAAEIVFPILAKHNVANIKFRFYSGIRPSDNAEDRKANEQHALKKFILYADSAVHGAAPTDWRTLALELEKALHAGGIRPGMRPVGNRRIKGSHYLSYRHAGGGGANYKPGKKGDARTMPKGKDDPFGTIQVGRGMTVWSRRQNHR